MDFSGVATGYLYSLILCYYLMAQDLGNWTKAHSVSLFHYTDDIMLTSDSLADLEATAHSL